MREEGRKGGGEEEWEGGREGGEEEWEGEGREGGEEEWKRKKGGMLALLIKCRILKISCYKKI